MPDAPAPSTPPPPLDEAGAGDGWIVLKFLLHAVAGVFRARVLLLAAAGVLAAELGVLACFLFQPNQAARVELLSPTVAAGPVDAGELLREAWAGQAGYWQAFVAPFWTRAATSADGFQQGLAGVVRLIVWSLFGVAIARIAALHLTHHEPPSMATALRRSTSGWIGQAAGPLVPLAVVGVSAGLVHMLGGMSRLWPIGMAVALLWPLLALLAAAAGVLAIGVAFGFPLMLASQSVERRDPFDAVSCGFAYVYQRPLRLAAYTAQALAVGAAAGAVVLLAVRVSDSVLVGWFEGLGYAFDDGGHLYGPGSGPSVVASIARFWHNLFLCLPAVFYAAYFWFAATAVYLLLRRDIDEKPSDEVHLDEAPAPDEAAAPAGAAEQPTQAPPPGEPPPQGAPPPSAEA